jgi:hypothetical protein
VRNELALAERLGMTRDEIRNRVSHAEMMLWIAYGELLAWEREQG